MIRGQKHLVSCRCVLPQFKSKANPLKHQFVVFSLINEDDTVKQKYAQCNNCGLIHKVTDICKSEILPGKESLASIITIDDIKASLPANLVDILERNNADLPSWEQAQFILEQKKWGEFIVLSQEDEGSTRQGKYIRLMSETFFKVETFSREQIVAYNEVD